MGRAPCCDKNGLKKGPWTQEEDQKLLDYIQKHGYGNWRTLPKNAGLVRCGKSCRLRWTNYLRPDIKRGRFSFEEEETIIQLHSILGNKWSAIAARLPGRTDNEIKNYWNTHIRKRLLRMGIDPVTHSPRLDLLDLSSIISSSFYNSSQMNISRLLGVQNLVNPELLRLATSLISSNNQNPNFIPQNVDQNNTTTATTLSNPLMEPQFQTPIQEFHQIIPIQETHQPHHQLMEFPDNFTSDWQIASNLSQDHYNYSPIPNYNTYYGSDQDQNQTLINNPSSENFSFGSSSPTQLNSNSTYEDERESYCSNMLKFEIPDILDVSEFI